jgi:hypothetical protein
MADFGTLSQDATQYFLNDVDVYIFDGTGTATTDWKLVGYTGEVKTVSPNQEFATSEYGIPRVTVAKKKIRESFNVQFTLRQFDADLIGYIFNGTYSTDASGENITVGTNEPTKSSYITRYVGEREDGKTVSLTIYKGQWNLNGDMEWGGENFNEVPVMVDALHDSSRSNTDNLYKWNVWNSNVSVTADVPS